jgi:subtilisin family serine protease
MPRSTLLCVFALALAPLASRAAPPPAPVDLLNGHDLAGWEYVTTPAAELSSVCHYNPDGSLAVAGKPVGFLATKATYENYRLHAEWRWPAAAAKNSNSGVLLHIASGPVNNTAWPVCFQMQMKLSRAGDLLPMAEAKFAEKLTTPPDAKTPQLDRAAAASEKPLGEWNSCDIVCRAGALEVTINGVLQNKVTHCVPAAGKVGFQLEGTPYELRHVLLTPLE